MDCNVSFEDLAAWQAGDLTPLQAQRMKTHTQTCATCRSRLATLDQAELLLRSQPVPVPSAGVLLGARRRLREATQAVTSPEILTMDEAAEFLRLTPEQMGELVDELPAFEMAGQIRIRRQKLLDWIEQRERGYTRQKVASWTARTFTWTEQKGVA